MQSNGAPPVGTVVDGYRFEGGNHRDRANWTQVEPIDVSADYGPGARRYPNGALVRIGPRGGVEEIKPRGEDGSGSPEIREFQANAAARATLMDQGVRDYEAARAAGYDPTSFWNGLARNVESFPVIGTGLSNLMRSDVADRGRAAELQFTDGALRTTTGANAPEPEVIRADRSYFLAPGESADVETGKAALRNRFRNQAVRIAGDAYISPDEGMREDLVGPTGPNGLPTYPTITERTAGIEDIKTPGEGLSVQWLTDNGVDTARFQSDVDYAQAEMSRLGYQPINGQWVNKYGQAAPIDQAKAAAQTKAVAPEPMGPDAVEQRRNENGLARRVDAFVRGAADTATFGLSDEITAGLNTVLPLERGSVGGWGQGFGPAYEQNLALARGIDRADAEQMPLTRGAGQVAGAIGGGVGAARLAPQTLRLAPRVAGATRMANAGRIAANTGRVAAGGAAAGGAYGFGSGDTLGERGGNALEGGVLGAVAAPVAGVVGERVIAPVLGSIGRAVSRPNALSAGVDRFSRRFRPDTNVLASRADELQGMGIEPAFVDLMDEGQRGLTRALATRQTPARQAVRDFAEGRAEGLQDRIATQARRTVSGETRSPIDLREAAARQAREQAAPLYEEAYAQPVQISDEIKSLLATPAGQAAMQRAQRIAANERRPFDPENMDMQSLDYMKRGLDDVLENYRDPVTGRLNLDTEGRAIEGIRQAFRTELDALNPAYAAARQAYGDSASLAEASNLGEQFLTMEADQFARQAGRLRPGEREVARAGARRAIERAAGTQGAAPGVAQRLASGREQAMRSQALLGEDAAAMQNAMRAEREGLMAARAINPAQGSVTSQAMSDQMQAAGNIGQTIGSALTGNLRGTVGGLARLVRLGYSDKEAEALVTAAIDPSRTREVIDMLAQRMNRQEARNLVRSLRYMAGQQSGAQAARNDQ